MNFVKWAITLLACLFVSGLLAFYKYTEISASIAAAQAYPEQSASVEVARVGTAPYQENITVIGELIAPRRLDLRNELAGIITAVNFGSGQRVTQGQLLLQLDIAVEEANLRSAQAQVELAQLAYNRAARLVESNLSSEDQRDQTRADLTRAQAQVDVLQRTIEKKTLRAPFAGRAGLHTFEPGQYLESNTFITTLIGDTDSMWVDFRVPQFYPRLAPGSTLNIDGIGTDSMHIVGELLAEQTVIEAGSRSRGYRAAIPATSEELIANTMVEVEVPVSTPRDMLSVPSLAVQNDPLGQFVYVLQEDAATSAYRATRQQVEVAVIENGVALLEPGRGLAEGTVIAGAGAFKLYPGILVYPGGRLDAQATEAGAD